MLSGNNLRAALQGLSPSFETGYAFRISSIKYLKTPLSAIGSLRGGGRYNIGKRESCPKFQPKAFAALYLCDNPVTGFLEVQCLTDARGQLMAHLAVPQVSFTIEYKLKSVLDITDKSVMAALSTNPMELTGKWKRYLADSTAIAPTQELACYAYHDTSIQALKVPTQYASETSKYNWVIFPDKVQADSDCSLNVVFPNDCLDAIDGLKSEDIGLQLL